MFELFNYGFIWIAIGAGVSLAVASSFLSPFLVFNNQSLIADGLSHVAFTGVAIGLIFSNEPLYIAMPLTIAASVFISFLSNSKKINNDVSIGVVSTTLLAIGLIIVSVSPGFEQNISSMLMGNLFTVGITELVIAIITMALILTFIFITYHKLVSITFDKEYATFKKIPVKLINYLLAALIGILVIIGVRTLGVLMISAFIIFPSLIASSIKKDFKSTIVIGTITSILTVFFGIFLAHHLTFPAGPTIILLFFLIYALIQIINFIKKRIKH